MAGAAAAPFAASAASAAIVQAGEGRRKADLGDGTCLNPIIAGDHPDPTILKDGDDYYMTFSSFLSYPGAVIWHSRDLVSWAPIGPALAKQLGSVWAMDLVKHKGRYYLYIPAQGNNESSVFVIHADHIRGPWSDPIDLKLSACIDPGHAVGEDGRRYLFVNGVRRVALSDDRLWAGSLFHPRSQPHLRASVPPLGSAGGMRRPQAGLRSNGSLRRRLPVTAKMALA